MQFINDVKEAESAPFGTAVVNGYGEVYQKMQDGLWYGAVDSSEPTSTDALFYGAVPRPVVWFPGNHGISYQDA